MRLFDPRDREITPQQARRYALFEVLHTIVDFAAASLFIIGSILFFFEQTMLPGTWCFLFGSIFFATKPTIRLAREIWLAKLKDIDRLAKMAPEGPGSFEKLPADNQNAVPDNGGRPDEEYRLNTETSTGRFNRES
ncbi:MULTISPECIES: YrhK family protein [Micrococcaceae]|uniref:YrhK family protein n=1 Tax=Micrococcaceae TaxID=1268 RepID=UPI0016104D22|nr:YrhK family protein [Citricoccus sp.]MBB5750084.1 hypothetical protein [Micrococcus sp. TA1]HRO94975.1 YrhK family protein [Citricoccus sp.]